MVSKLTRKEFAALLEAPSKIGTGRGTGTKTVYRSARPVMFATNITTVEKYDKKSPSSGNRNTAQNLQETYEPSLPLATTTSHSLNQRSSPGSSIPMPGYANLPISSNSLSFSILAPKFHSPFLLYSHKPTIRLVQCKVTSKTQQPKTQRHQQQPQQNKQRQRSNSNRRSRSFVTRILYHLRRLCSILPHYYPCRPRLRNNSRLLSTSNTTTYT